MRKRHTDVTLYRKLVLKEMLVYRCSRCGAEKLASESLEVIEALDERLRQFGLAGAILENLLVAGNRTKVKSIKSKGTANARKGGAPR